MDENSFALVVTEKPGVAKIIADAIAGGMQKKNGYLEGGGYLVSWCLGHLVEPAQPGEYKEAWKKWSLDSLPVLPETWKYVIKKETEGQYEALRRLLHREDVSEVVCATDAGREGELIFRLVYETAGCRKPFRRLWISSMEEKAIREGFENLQPGSAYDNLYQSALCRQKADWLVGINGTRLFTALFGGRVLKAGRVQTPTLAMLVDRERQIRDFQKEKYYTVHILINGMDAATGRIDDKKKADEITGACRNGQAFVMSVLKEEKAAAPPKLYDLTTLQRDANRLFGFTAKQTLEYTQSLYEKKLVTYPRTDSRYLSDDMGQTAENVAGAVLQIMFPDETAGFHPDVRRILDSRKVTDHHAIIPTINIVKAGLPALPEMERKILFLTAGRLLCAAGENHIYETVRAEFSCSGYVFTVSGKSVMHNGWKYFEEAFSRSFKALEDREDRDAAGEKKLPEISEGQSFTVSESRASEHFTAPPKHFTEDSLLSAMEHAGAEDMVDDVERKGLGTPATRADIIEKLVRDGFVKRERKQLLPSEDGIKLIGVLPDTVKSPKLTAEWENSLALVAAGKLDADVFMDGIAEMVSGLVRDCGNASVSEESKKLFSKKHTVLGICPKCGGQVIKGKYGAYCAEKCGMGIAKYYSTPFTYSQVKSLLDGKKILLKGLKGRDGKPYDLCLEPAGIEEYSYEKNGKPVSGYQFSYKKSYPGRK